MARTQLNGLQWSSVQKTTGFNTLSPLTTKGDIVVFDSTNNVRLPVGTDGQMLFANSAQSTGLQWLTFEQDITSTTLFTTASTTDVLITGFTLTPGKGTFLVLVNLEINNNSNNRTMISSLYLNGTIVTGSSVTFINASAANRYSVTIMFPVTVTNAAHVLDVRVRTSAGTLSVNNRFMGVLRKAI